MEYLLLECIVNDIESGKKGPSG